MPMQPSPRAETSRLLFPSLRFCIIEFPKFQIPANERSAHKLCGNIYLLRWSRQTQGFQPEIELVDPMVARFSLFAHPEAVTARAKDVQFWFVTCRLKRVVEPRDERLCAFIVLRHGEEDGRQSLRNGRHLVVGSAVNRSRVVRSRLRL